jgi:F0F1-type ATP synthase membrane subunit b/b'
MTIQPSLVIWTIIGFVTLSLILNRFLFEPILKVMDARNEKIKAGEENRRIELERREKTRKALEISNAARQQEALKAMEKELDNERKKTETILADKKAEYDAELEKIRQQYNTDTRAAEENLSENIDKLAQKYVKTQIL